MPVQPIVGILPFVGSPGPYEFLIIAIIALLLFGKRLPDVARSLGKGIVEFKKGVQGIEEDVSSPAGGSYTSNSSASRPDPVDEMHETTAPKFTPPEDPPA